MDDEQLRAELQKMIAREVRAYLTAYRAAGTAPRVACCKPVVRARFPLPRGQQIRAAKRKHQKSPEGRDDHRDRNRAYRARRRLLRVTDHTSPAPSDSDSIDPAEPSPSKNGPGSVSGEARYAVRPEFEPACIICGRTRDRLLSRFVGGRPPERRKL